MCCPDDRFWPFTLWLAGRPRVVRVTGAEARTEPWVVRAARLRPRHIAIDAPDGVLTYAELAAASSDLASRELVGLPAGVQAAIALPGGAAFAVALHACLIAGVVAVPDDLRLPVELRAERTRGCEIRLESTAVVASIAADADADADAATRADAETRADAATRADSDNTDGAVRPAGSGRRLVAGSGADASTPAIRITTSGTTGHGTPVHLSRGALLWNALGSAAALGQPPQERWLSAMPVSHVGGLTVLIRSAIAATTALVRPTFDLDEQVAMLQAGQATITSVVPTTLSRLLDAGLSHPPNLRLILLGGAPIPPELVARAEAAGVAVASTYGLSEACSQVLTRGRPLFCTRVVLRAEITGPLAQGSRALESPTPAGHNPASSTPASSTPATALRAGSASETDRVGLADHAPDEADHAPDEVLVQGPTLATGVAGPDGWLATGDRGRRLPDGSIAIVGRIAETIVTGGENVAPTEIEQHLVAQPSIADAAALGVAHPEWGEQVEARVVLADGYDLDEPALREALLQLLPSYAVPKRIVAVDALPRTPTGKLIRRALV